MALAGGSRMGIGDLRRQNGNGRVNDREGSGYGRLGEGRVPIREGMGETGAGRDCGNWRLSSSLIRNLEEVFWFGTPRVLEEDRKQEIGNRE